ncbi:MAG: hypothetical protein JWM80_2233 [Cyanobacteria bacterium RYN_339]|nr:hypothetical protein [Cyanobacteria bacterium RYN_339]
MTNEAVFRGQNLNSGWPLEAKLPYVDAKLTDLSPATPLNPWLPGDSRVEVRAARVEVGEQGLARAIASLAGDKLQHPRVWLKPGNRVGITGTARWQGLPVPVAMDYQLERVDGHTVRLTPCGLTGGAARLAGLDFRKLLVPPAGAPATVAADGVITLDLAKLAYLKADLKALETGNGTLTATIGGQPPRGPKAPAWFELACKGDLDTGAGLLHDATAVCTAPATLPLNDWQHAGSARLVRGRVAIAPDMLARQIEAAEPMFKVAKVTLVGTTYRVEGTYNAFVKLPTRFDLAFTRTAAGQLRLVPANTRVMGFRAGKGGLGDDLAQLGFLKPDGDGFLVDLKAAAGLDMPKIGPLEAQDGCLMLGNP